LLILPRLDVPARNSAWISLLDLSLPDLPSLDLGRFSPEIAVSATASPNKQTREIFADEATKIVSRQRHIRWLTPSRDETAERPALETETPAIRMADSENESIEESSPINVQGGRERGLLIHKLIEEVLTGETGETEEALRVRAATLIHALSNSVDDPTKDLVPAELASSVLRALAIPEIAALRPGLKPEFPVYSSVMKEEREEAMAGVADAIAFDPSGIPQVVVDWKSDVVPSAVTIEHYRAQVRAYLNMTEIDHGLIVLITSGTVIPVMRMTASAGASESVHSEQFHAPEVAVADNHLD